MICEKCKTEFDGEICPACTAEQTPAANENTETVIEVTAPVEEAPIDETPAEETPAEEAPAEEAPAEQVSLAEEEDHTEEHCECCECAEHTQTTVCEKCGYEFVGETCPVCELVAARRAKKSKLGFTGLILSIIGVVTNFLFGLSLVTLPVFITSLVFSIIGKKKNKKDKCATAGICISAYKIVSNIVSTVISVVAITIFTLFCCIVMIAALESSGASVFSDVDSVF